MLPIGVFWSYKFKTDCLFVTDLATKKCQNVYNNAHGKFILFILTTLLLMLLNVMFEEDLITVLKLTP